MRVRPIAGGTLALLLVLTVLTGRAYAASPTLTVSVNRPTVAGAEDGLLLTQLAALVDAAATGSTIRASLPTLAEQEVTDHLLVAQNQRQVTVLAVGEQCARRDSAGTCAPPPAALTTLANGLVPGRFTWCVEGCLTASGATVAAGYWLFDALTDGRRDVVVQTSADPSALTRRVNHDMVTVADDARLAAGYRDYFAAQAARQAITFTGSVVGADGRSEVYFGPRSASAADPLVGLLTDLACPGGTIRVIAGTLRTDRSTVLDLLVAKKAAGCTVEVALSDRNDALPVLGHASIEVFTHRAGGCRYPAGGNCDTGAIGSTVVLVSGTSTSTGVARNFVVTGPRALSDQQLHRDDSVLLKLTDPAVYQAYDAQWQRLRDEALRIRPDSWPNATRTMANSAARGDQDGAAVAANRTGYLAVAWEDDQDGATPQDTAHTEVFLRLYQDGASRYEKKISSSGAGSWRHVQPDVALDDAGNA
jgi:hypothetical protein